MDLHLNHETNRWEWRERGRMVLSFAYNLEAGQYTTDRDEPLGREWFSAKAKAEALAEKRMARW